MRSATWRRDGETEGAPFGGGEDRTRRPIIEPVEVVVAPLGARGPDLIDKALSRGERPMDLGIDIGTSAVKGVLADADDRLVDQESQPLTVSRPQPLWSEQDPADWWRATGAA